MGLTQGSLQAQGFERRLLTLVLDATRSGRIGEMSVTHRGSRNARMSPEDVGQKKETRMHGSGFMEYKGGTVVV